LETGCLILAAGEGRRFGGAKQLALLDGRPLLAHVLELAAPYDPLVVLGARAEEILAAVEIPRHVIAADWAEGQAASLRAGVAALGDVERALILLGDQPFLTREVIEAVLALGGTARATYDGVPGHPVVLGREVLDAVPSLTGDAGARELLRDARTVEAAHLCDPTDIDTPDQL
jgi:CTP:molybdopterin cytidylyltransferase MocA